MLKTAWPTDWLCQGATLSLELPASYSIFQLKPPARPPCLTECSNKPSHDKQHCTNAPAQVTYSPNRKQPAQEHPDTSLPERTSCFWAQMGRAVLYCIFLQCMVWGKPLRPRDNHLPTSASFTRKTERIPPLAAHAFPRGESTHATAISFPK